MSVNFISKSRRNKCGQKRGPCNLHFKVELGSTFIGCVGSCTGFVMMLMQRCQLFLFPNVISVHVRQVSDTRGPAVPCGAELHWDPIPELS